MNNGKIMLSATRVSMFLQCKYRYWLNYVLHRPKLPSTAFKLGISVHKALEIAGKIWQKKEKFTAYDIGKIKKAYIDKAVEEGIDDLAIYNEGLFLVLEKLKEFEVGRILSAETRFEISTNDGIPIIGAMDKVVELDSDTILIVDYKTNKFVYTAEEMKNDIQLSMYDLVASIKFPNYKRIILCLDFLRSEPMYAYRTNRARKEFSQYLVAIYNEMLNFEEKDAKPSFNDMCSWCDFRGECPTYIEASRKDKLFKKNLEDFEEGELVSEYLDIKSRKRALDNYERRLKNHIIKKIDVDSRDLSSENKSLYVRQNPLVVYDPKTVYSNVPLEEFFKMVTVSKRSVDEFLENDQMGKNKVVETATRNYTNPFLAVRNIKKNS